MPNARPPMTSCLEEAVHLPGPFTHPPAPHPPPSDCPQHPQSAPRLPLLIDSLVENKKKKCFYLHLFAATPLFCCVHYSNSPAEIPFRVRKTHGDDTGCNVHPHIRHIETGKCVPHRAAFQVNTGGRLIRQLLSAEIQKQKRNLSLERKSGTFVCLAGAPPSFILCIKSL